MDAIFHPHLLLDRRTRWLNLRLHPCLHCGISLPNRLQTYTLFPEQERLLIQPCRSHVTAPQHTQLLSRVLYGHRLHVLLLLPSRVLLVPRRLRDNGD
jgi:hypothetical protein